MMPDQPEFTKCHACACFCWVKDMTRLGDQQPWEDNACRDPLSYDVIITEIWDDLEPVVERLARHFSCQSEAARSMIESLPITMAKDVSRNIAEAIEDEFEDLADVQLAPCRVSTEPAPSEWSDAPEVSFIDAEDYKCALNNGSARNVDEEIFLRIAAWQAGNDRFRDGEELWVPCSKRGSAVIASAERLLQLLDGGKDSNCVLGAELSRELERYDDAARWLDQERLEGATFEDAGEKEGLMVVARMIRELAEQRDSALVQISAA